LLAMLLAWGGPASGYAQPPDREEPLGTPAENLSAGRTWGLGARFPAPFLSFLPGGVSPVEASPVALLRYWLTPRLAVEGGGWLGGYRAPWGESSFVLLAGGLLLKLVDAERGDLYAAGRGLHARESSREKGVFFGEPPMPMPMSVSVPGPRPAGPAPEEVAPPCCPPWESESLTLALEGAVGAEWSLSPHLAVEAELSAFYAQTVTTSTWPYRPPFPEAPTPPEPQQRVGDEVSTTLSWGFMLRVGLSLYLGMTSEAETGSESEGKGEGEGG